MFMPGPRLVEAEFRNELIHLRVELDDHLVGIIMIAGDVVARRVARGAPDLLYAGGTKTVRRHCMVCGVLELEGDVMKPRLRGADHVDHVVVSVTGEKGRDPLDIVRVAEAKELLVEFDELLACRENDSEMSKPNRRHGGFLESRRGGLHCAIELKDVVAGALDLDKL